MRTEEYHKLADLEERMWFFRAYHRRFVHWLGRSLPPGRARILDAGCGTGGAIKALRAARPEWRVTGLDFSPLACELARERTSVDVVEGSICAMPFPDATFDAIFSADVVCQVSDPGRALAEFARCVRPGGVVMVNAPAFPWLWSHHDVAVESVQRFTRAGLAGLVRAAHLKIEYASYANSFLLPPAIVRRKLFPPRGPAPASDVALLPAPLEALFGGLGWLEFQWTRHGWPVPAGLSVFIVARRM